MSSLAVSDAGYALRGPRPEDLPFVRSSWTQSYGKYATFSKEPKAISADGPARLPSHIYVPEQHQLIARILSRSTVTTVVACNPEDADQIFGYLVFETRPPSQAVAHYLYVKDAFRKRGLARALLQSMRAVTGEGPVWASHWSRLIAGKRSAQYPFEFNSYKVEGP